MATQSLSRKERRALRLRRAQRRRITASVAIMGGILLLAAVGWMLWRNRQASAVVFDFSAADIANDQPLHAVHEMGEGPPIPFLPKGDPQPKIAIEERYFDFGTLGSTDVVTREFVIANVGEAPLTISRAYTTCGCTIADFTSAVIPPGKISIMTLAFDAGFHDVSGQTVRRGVIIENNDPGNSSAEIWVQASVRNSP
ncbi:MAG: DUF1573 domain-containing protein [Anaerolineales bacterium]|nr:MAG: DUF1573 domain-containing protein [Anaerolineales bacterium]